MSDAVHQPSPEPMPRRARIAVLASGGGSNLQALIDHFAGPARAVAEIVWVGSDRPTSGALTRAATAGIAQGVVATPQDGQALLAQLARTKADVLVLAGYLQYLPADVVAAFRGRVLNVHPALLPAFGGAGMYGQRIHAAVLARGATITGVTVHFVDEEFDHGPIVAQWPVAVMPGDTPTTLAARVLQVEHQLLPLCVAAVASGAIVQGEDGKVRGQVNIAPLIISPPHPL